MIIASKLAGLRRVGAAVIVVLVVASFVALPNPAGAAVTDTYSVNDVAQDEGSGGGNTSFTFTITRDAPVSVAETVDWTASPTTAQPGDLGPTTSGSLTFPADQTTATFAVDVVADGDGEPAEQFAVTIAPQDGSCKNGDCTGAGTIQNDDGTPPSLTVNNTLVTEGNTGTVTATFTVTKSGTTNQAVTVDYATADGTATAGQDYTAKAGTLTFAAGESSKTVEVAVLGDQMDEANETFALNLSNATNATIADGSGDGTISDDDAPPTVSVEGGSSTEGTDTTPPEGSTVDFVVTLSAASGKTVTVEYATADGSAKAGSDYTTATGTLTFPPGHTTETVSVAITHDSTDEVDETFALNLANPSNATVLVGAATGTIIDDDGAPSLTIADVTVTEGDSGTTNATFTVTLAPASAKTVTVDYATANGTATAGSDYTAVSGALTFAAGEETKTVTVAVQGDTVDEADSETFTVDLANATNATIGDAQAIGTITDDDPVVTISVDDVTVTEGNSATTPASFTITLSKASGRQVTVDYATANGTAVAGSDYTAASGTLTFLPGQTTKQVVVDVIADSIDEDDQTYSLALSNAVSASIADAAGAGMITDDDAAPTLSIGDRTEFEGNSGSVTYFFTVTKTGATERTVTVDYATEDRSATSTEDFAAASGQLSFGPEETQRAVSVTVTGDTAKEPDETFTVKLSTPVHATITDGSGTGTIKNDDGTPPALSISAFTVAEGNSGMSNRTFTITLSEASTLDVTVDYATADGTAVAGEDYNATNGTATIAARDTSATVTVEVHGDTEPEPEETFTVALSNARNATVADGSGTFTITNDDGDPPTISIADAAAVTEGSSGPTNATFTVTLSAQSGKTVTVDWATADGSAVASGDYTAGSGTVTFAPSETEKSVTVAVQGDTVDEGNETFTVELSAPSNATLADGTGVGTITDDDDPPAVSIADASAVTEGNSDTTDASFTVTLSAQSGKTVTVDWATADGSAVAPGDYTAASGTVTFPAGETEKTVTVAVKGDTVDEANETFTVELSAPSNATLADGTGVGTITDDDGEPSLSIAGTSVAEGDSGTKNATLKVTLSPASGKTVTVEYATGGGTARAGVDYTSSSGTLTFLPGETSKTITVAVKGDLVQEVADTLNVTLSTATSAAITDGTGVLTILNDDAGGYGLVDAVGKLSVFGDLSHVGDMSAHKLNAPVTGLAFHPKRDGYWLVAQDGGIFTFGNARFYGSTGDSTLAAPVLGMEPTPTGEGYWLFASDGGIFSFGDAKFYGSMAGKGLNAPVVGMEVAPDGKGYWLVAEDGGIFSFGSAAFHGSTGDMDLNEPVFDMASTSDGRGYWLVARDGGIFTFGSAVFHHSAVPDGPARVIGMGRTDTDGGYWIADQAGRVFAKGDATYLGDTRASATRTTGFASVHRSEG